MKLFWNALRLSSLLLGFTLLLSSRASAAGEPVVAPEANALDLSQPSTDAFAQVTSVSQLSDVQPTDWAFQALQSLVERYGCIVGYPDGTYRGNRALTRYEFAAGLNAALDRVVASLGCSVDLLGFGEALHGDEAIPRLRNRLFRRLVEALQHKGKRVSVVSTLATNPPMVADELRRQADVFLDIVELQSKIGREPG